MISFKHRLGNLGFFFFFAFIYSSKIKLFFNFECGTRVHGTELKSYESVTR